MSDDGHQRCSIYGRTRFGEICLHCHNPCSFRQIQLNVINHFENQDNFGFCNAEDYEVEIDCLILVNDPLETYPVHLPKEIKDRLGLL